MKYIFALLAAAAVIQAAPKPQGVYENIPPKDPAPSGCMPSMEGVFGITVQNVTGGGAMGASQIPDGQPQASGSVSQISDGQVQATPVQQISDGQVQATPVSQISDGQVQNPPMKTMPAVSQIGDGQIQATYVKPVNQISDGQVQATPVQQISDGQVQATPVQQISDGQVQATPVQQISDGQVQATPVSQISDGQVQATPVSQISDGQVQATPASQISDGQVQATGMPSSMKGMMACKGDGTLSLTLADGILKDGKGRTGYIAANYQFQFDAPPQTGAIYTSGFSICGNGSLALGGSTTFYQCLSGDFYNLYNENWAPQCNPVTIDAISLVNC